jgi:hypothetical protein
LIKSKIDGNTGKRTFLSFLLFYWIFPHSRLKNKAATGPLPVNIAGRQTQKTVKVVAALLFKSGLGWRFLC